MNNVLEKNHIDYYLLDENVYRRLVTEWNKYGKIIIAYDFDNTVFDYHDKGLKFDNVIRLLRICKQIGAHFIVFTASEESRYDFIREYLTTNDIPFDTINENLEFIKCEGRKLYYNILLDDRAGLSSAYTCLNQAANHMLKNII